MRNNNILGTRECFTKGHKYVIILILRRMVNLMLLIRFGVGTCRIGIPRKEQVRTEGRFYTTIENIRMHT